MQDPDTIKMIHERMIQEELQRNYPEHHQYISERRSRTGPVTWVRAATARTLFALGGKIAPISRPASDQSAPASTVIRGRRRLKTG